MIDPNSDLDDHVRSLDRLLPSFTKRPFEHVADETIVAIRKRLQKLETLWPNSHELSSAEGSAEGLKLSDSPRLYTFLRALCYDHTLAVEAIRKSLINDYFLPISPDVLKPVPTQVNRHEFHDIQASFMSDHARMAAQTLTGLDRDHRQFEKGTDWFDDVALLGHGGSAMVVRVRHGTSNKEFACKRINRGPNQLRNFRDFHREVNVLKHLQHDHVVKLVASYTDAKSFSLLLLPVANGTLETLLQRMSPWPPGLDSPLPVHSAPDISILRRAFGCLVSTVKYLHKLRVRHKDIKPANILITLEGQVCLCDFGISLDYSMSQQNTTEGPSQDGFTRGYCAPEVNDVRPRNELSEIWSLGRVFFDMIVVLRKHSLQEARTFIGLDSSTIGSCIAEYLLRLQIGSNDEEGALIDLIPHMTAEDRAARPSASQILDAGPFTITRQSSSDSYIGPCCTQPYGDEGSTEHAQTSFDTSQHRVASTSLESDGRDHAENTFVSSALRQRTFDSYHYGVAHQVDMTGYLHHSDDARTRRRREQEDTGFRRSRGSASTSSQLQRISSDMIAPSSRSSVHAPTLGCLCAERTMPDGDTEVQLLQVPFVSFRVAILPRSSEVDTHCTSLNNTIKVFEAYIRGTRGRSGIWFKTRRLVISEGWDSLAGRKCTSFWLPLAHVQCQIRNTQLALRWSDCDQREERRLGDSNLTYSRVYQPTMPNNELHITFTNVAAAEQLRYIMTHAEADTTSQWRSIDVSQKQNLLILDGNSTGHYVAHVSNITEHGVESNMYIHETPAMLDIWSSRRNETSPFMLSLRWRGGVSTPIYHSNFVDQPSDDGSVVAECAKVDLIYSQYRLDFDLAPTMDNVEIPSSLQEALVILTHWRLCFFAANARVSAPGSFKKMKKNYGSADVFLWEQIHNTNVKLCPLPVLAFRQSNPGKGFRWRTGFITTRSAAEYRDSAAIITLFGKSSGDLLDTTSMATVMEAELHQSSSGRSASAPSKVDQANTLRLEFAIADDYETFLTCFIGLCTTLRRHTGLEPSNTRATGSSLSTSRTGSFQASHRS